MPRAVKPQAPSVRSDGQPTPGNLQAPGQGQPNGNAPRSAVTQVLARAGAGTSMPYGEASQLASNAAQTPPPPPGISPEAHAAHLALRSYKPNVTPLFAPTQNPMEPVTAGAPLDAGPTNPMAVLQGQQNASIATILQQAAAATGNPELQRLAAQAAQTAGQGQPQANPFASEPPMPTGQ